MNSRPKSLLSLPLLLHVHYSAWKHTTSSTANWLILDGLWCFFMFALGHSQLLRRFSPRRITVTTPPASFPSWHAIYFTVGPSWFFTYGMSSGWVNGKGVVRELTDVWRSCFRSLRLIERAHIADDGRTSRMDSWAYRFHILLMTPYIAIFVLMVCMTRMGNGHTDPNSAHLNNYRLSITTLSWWTLVNATLDCSLLPTSRFW